MRGVSQYDLIRKEKGKKFSYRNLRPVYVIVLMEKSPEKFRQHPDRYIHRFRFSFGSGLSLSSLMNFIYIPLDIFRAMPHNKLKELDAWLYFPGSDDLKDMQHIVQKYSFFRELYQDIICFRYQPKEVLLCERPCGMRPGAFRDAALLVRGGNGQDRDRL